MFAIIAGTLVAVFAFAVYANRADVAMTVIGYLASAIAILVFIFFVLLFAYTNFVYNLFMMGAN
jgi:hypothetical protein